MANRPAAPTGAAPTFIDSSQPLARLARPIVRFLRIETAGAILLVVATVVALVWANSPWRAGYAALWATPIELRVGSFHFAEDFGHFINDGLMAIFFFVVGLEIKRELVTGELRDRRAAIVPMVAAVGGMAVPALIFLVINAGGPGSDGWGIPMATDIAFVLGAVALLGRRVPASLKVFLLTLAIVDDVGAIIVIGLYYSTGVQLSYLLVATGLVLLIIAVRRARITFAPLYLVLALALWWVVYESGIHATIAGVIFGLLMSARPLQDDLDTNAVAAYLSEPVELDADHARRANQAVNQAVSPCERLEDLLHPWTGYVIIPLFALANAGVTLKGDAVTSPSAVFVGVFFALVIGKPVGIAGATWLAVRIRVGKLPHGVSMGQLVGAGALAGIGFTVSLFITGLAFTDPSLETDAKLGILLASLAAAIAGSVLLYFAHRSKPPCNQVAGSTDHAD